MYVPYQICTFGLEADLCGGFFWAMGEYTATMMAGTRGRWSVVERLRSESCLRVGFYCLYVAVGVRDAIDRRGRKKKKKIGMKTSITRLEKERRHGMYR